VGAPQVRTAADAREQDPETNVTRNANDRGPAIWTSRGRWLTGRKAYAFVGLLLAVTFCLQWERLAATEGTFQDIRSEQRLTNLNAQRSAGGLPALSPDRLRALIKTDPTAFFHSAAERYERNATDYDCTFTKQERIDGHLMPEQVMQVRLRENPFSVDMLWTRNADQARRATYVEGRWTGKHGEKLALVEPAGAVARLLLDRVLCPVDDPEAKLASRHPIDDFGFANTMRLVLKGCRPISHHTEYSMRYVGEGTVDGRPTYVVERRPVASDGTGAYEDELLVVDVDQEYLLPTCCTMYADEAGTELVERYVTTNIRFNVGLTDQDFAATGN